MAPIAKGCQEFRAFTGPSRRDMLRVGMLGGFGLTLAGALRRDAMAAAAEGARAKNVIFFWLQGGVSHHETFDPKPNATEDVRGEFRAINTKLPGVLFGEYLPRLAGMADKLAVVRSVTHSESAHQRGSIYMVEGRRPSPATGVNHSGNPEIGSIVAHELGPRDGLPAYVSIPGNDFTSRFTGPGYLPGTAAAFRGYEAKSLEVNGGMTSDRFESRLKLRESMLSQLGQSRAEASTSWDAFDEQAVEIIRGGKGAAAFDISGEPDSIKNLYGVGKHKSNKPDLALTARRLIEAGVRYVTIGRNSWDHHSNIFPQLKSRLPSFDDAFAGLVTDLEDRGLLDETLVIYMTEYGRTPKVNKDAGRDHWPAAFSVAFAGAGIRGGQVLGSTDASGAAVTDRPVSPEEIAGTILSLVGVDPGKTFYKPDGRPIQYIDHGKPVAEILA